MSKVNVDKPVTVPPPTPILPSAALPSLRSGLLGVRPHVRTALGALTGHTKTHPPFSLGSCDIRCRSASLWPFVALMLGFRIGAIYFTPRHVTTGLSAFLGPAVPFHTATRPRLSGPDVRLILSDWDSVPCFSASRRFWETSSTPFVFFAPRAFSPPTPPPGWSLFPMVVPHASVGGSTDGSFAVCLLLPTRLARTDDCSTPEFTPHGPLLTHLCFPANPPGPFHRLLRFLTLPGPSYIVLTRACSGLGGFSLRASGTRLPSFHRYFLPLGGGLAASPPVNSPVSTTFQSFSRITLIDAGRPHYYAVSCRPLRGRFWLLPLTR